MNEAAAAPDCYRHPGTAGTNRCGTCLKYICDACLQWARMEPVCPGCGRRSRGRTDVRQFVIVGAVLVLGCAGAFAAMFFYEKPFDYGKHSGDVFLLQQELQANPCDRTAIVKLGDTMLLAGNRRGALDRANDWLERCGEYERLRWVTYSAYRDLNRDADAIREATRLIELDPDDKDYRWWRGIIHERGGQLAKAAADYEKALEIQPRLTSIPVNLADVYERLGRPCDAAVPLERVIAHYPDRVDAPLGHRVARLKQECAATGGTVTTALATSGGGAALASAPPTAGRIDMLGASVRLPDGFAELPPGWDDAAHDTAWRPLAARGFVRPNRGGSTVVEMRAIHVETNGKPPQLDRLRAVMQRLSLGAGGDVVRRQEKRSRSTLDVGLSFDRAGNAGEWRGSAGWLAAEKTLRIWTVQCEDRPAVASSDCEGIVRSLAVIDTSSVTPLDEVYPGK